MSALQLEIGSDANPPQEQTTDPLTAEAVRTAFDEIAANLDATTAGKPDLEATMEKIATVTAGKPYLGNDLYLHANEKQT